MSLTVQKRMGRFWMIHRYALGVTETPIVFYKCFWMEEKKRGSEKMRGRQCRRRKKEKCMHFNSRYTVHQHDRMDLPDGSGHLSLTIH